MSFGKRLALFFILIALLPTLALLGMLVIVSEDSRQGKADARLAASLETALAVYAEDVASGRERATALSDDPELGRGLAEGERARVRAFARRVAARPGIEGVLVRDAAGDLLARTGGPDAIAFGGLALSRADAPVGLLAVSVTPAEGYAREVRRLTKLELVLSGADGVLSGTQPLPEKLPEPGRSTDAEIDGREFRAHLVELDPAQEETLLLLGPAESGGFLGVEGPAAALLVVFLVLGVLFAWALARTLTALHTQVAEQAVTDPLTGLWNRRRMNQLLEREVDRAIRFGHQLSMLILDIDDFKQINDAYGHPKGDAVLETVADVVRQTTRSIDVGARYGGDELALVLLETETDGALVLAERLRNNIGDARFEIEDGDPISLTTSIGVATLPDAAQTVEDLIEAADQALLAAKREGKNQTRVAPSAVTERPE